MGANTTIEWTTHTFNGWWGCTEVPLPSGSACDNCYAREFAKRFGVKWGNEAERRIASENVWAQPLMWNNAAEKAGRRDTVFAFSMGDVFEPKHGLEPYVKRLRGLIADTPNLIWLLLTKRPAVAAMMVDRMGLPDNALVGVTIESQEAFDARRRQIESIGKTVFLSCEPMLSAINFPPGWLETYCEWVICGGESGHKARPMQPDWARGLRDQAVAAGTPFFFKQAKINGKMVSMPEIDGRAWGEMPEL